MKRVMSLILSTVLLLSLMPACQGPASESDPVVSPSAAEAERSAREIAGAVFLSSGYDGRSDIEYLTTEEGGGDFLSSYLENAYGLDAGAWEDAAVIRATGASAFELAVLRLEDEEAAVRTASALMNYIFHRQGDFAGYAPAEADMVANGSINQDGPYAALFICPDTDGADAAFTAAVNGEIPPEPVVPTDGPVDPVESENPVDPVDDVDKLLALLVENSGRWDDISDLEWLDSGDADALANYITDVYGLDRDQWTEAAIAKGKGDSVFEIAVLRIAEGQDSWAISETLALGYLDTKETLYAQSPAQAEMLGDAVAGQPRDSDFIILAVCSKPEGTLMAAVDLLGVGGYTCTQRHSGASKPSAGSNPNHPDRVAFVQPNTDDMSLYDTSAIRAAWEAGDPSGLSDYDKDIYDAAQKVLGKMLKAGMSDLEKETAIYGWVVNNVDYDWTHQDIMAATPRESFTPYGGLVNHAAVCLGYAVTFQLLCDLAGVECITVVGAAFSSREDHAWNMVRLDGAWYCVEVTWDANYRENGITKGRERDWDYFNVTSDYMAATDHQWDYANTPEAVTEGNGRG